MKQFEITRADEDLAPSRRHWLGLSLFGQRRLSEAGHYRLGNGRTLCGETYAGSAGWAVKGSSPKFCPRCRESLSDLRAVSELAMGRSSKA